VPTGASDGVIFEILEGTTSLILLTLDGAAGSNETFDAEVAGPNLTVRVNDRGTTGYDWFFVDAKFMCQTTTTWPSVMTASAARAGQFVYNDGASSTISQESDSKVRCDPGWSPRPTDGDSYADLVLAETVCGTGLHLVGNAGMETSVPTGKSDGVIFEILEGTTSLILLTLNGTAGSNETFDVAVAGPNLTVRVNDRGSTGWDWFFVDANFLCPT